MNYYERVDNAINYIENNLHDEIIIDDVAKMAFMSVTNLYRMFFALTGYSVKEYIRNRRFYKASIDIINGSNVLDVAIKYGFESHEAFTRSFKKVTGKTPSSLKKVKRPFLFERMNIMDKYFEIQDKELLDKYPDIKVLKELPKMRVASYCYYGKEPETNAWNVMSEWLQRSGLSIEKDKLRFFGFNNPSPGPNDTEYGYEVWTIISDDVVINDDKIKVKEFPGGLYAVTSVKGGEENIFPTWQRLSKWLNDSKYTYGGHQWLEEHLGFNDEFEHLGGLDLYIPIELRKEFNNKELVEIKPMKLACYKEVGKDAVNKARKFFIKWLNDNNIVRDNLSVIAWYNHEREGLEDYFCQIGIFVEEDFKINDERVQIIDFKGGQYLVTKSKFKRLGYEWNVFIKWMQNNKKYNFGLHQFFEQYIINNGKLEMESDVLLYMPITKNH
ncbi:AraC family transcriptional regulator [Mycoplasmatota bacterium]|nr:AraC family transcriptional regulator [Mycoplasmatota bacterium]